MPAPEVEATQSPAPIEAPPAPTAVADDVAERLERANARIAELESGVPKVKAETVAKPPATAFDVANQQRIVDLRLDHKLSREAAEAVISYEQKGIQPDDALAFAQLRRPELFGEDKRGFNEETHASNPPGAGSGQPDVEPELTGLQKVSALRHDLHLRGKAALAGARGIVKMQMGLVAPVKK